MKDILPHFCIEYEKNDRHIGIQKMVKFDLVVIQMK